MNLKQLIKRAKEYVELEANTKVRRISFAGSFQLLGSKDIVLSVTTTDKKDPKWWVVGGSTPMNLYSKTYFKTADEAFSMHTGIMVCMSADDFDQSTAEPKDVGYDAFICHASEDKKDLVRPLAKALTKMGYRIWYDEFELHVGDSLRQSIDKGLVNSRFGIVVLSKAFFAKKWPQYELDGLTARQMEGHTVILPIWHKITKKTLLKYSPPLADRVAVITEDNTINKIAQELARTLDKR